MHHESIATSTHIYNMYKDICLHFSLDYHRLSCDSYLSKSEEELLKLLSGNPSPNPLPVKHTQQLEDEVRTILGRIAYLA